MVKLVSKRGARPRAQTSGVMRQWAAKLPGEYLHQVANDSPQLFRRVLQERAIIQVAWWADDIGM